VRLRQILTNLIGNAIKFTEAGRVVVRMEVSEHRESLTVKFCVDDTGIGIPLEQPPSYSRALHKRQLHHSQVRGHGLGLAISKQLVELLGARLASIASAAEAARSGSLRLLRRRLPRKSPGHRRIERRAGRHTGWHAAMLVAGGRTEELRGSSLPGLRNRGAGQFCWTVPELRLAGKVGSHSMPFCWTLTFRFDTSVGAEIAADPVLFNTALISMTSIPVRHHALLRERGSAPVCRNPFRRRSFTSSLQNMVHESGGCHAPVQQEKPVRVAGQPDCEEEPPRVLVAEDIRSIRRSCSGFSRSGSSCGRGVQRIPSGRGQHQAAYDLILMDLPDA